MSFLSYGRRQSCLGGAEPHLLANGVAYFCEDKPAATYMSLCGYCAKRSLWTCVAYEVCLRNPGICWDPRFAQNIQGWCESAQHNNMHLWCLVTYVVLSF